MIEKQPLRQEQPIVPFTVDLSSALTLMFKSKKVFLTGRGASAIYVALRSIGRPGSFVGMPSNICPSVPMAVIRAGYRPWFLDINIDDFNIQVSDLSSLPDNTSALIAPHIFGHPLDIIPILGFCELRKITIIEDIAQSFGMKIKGINAGCFGDISVASFHPSKLLPGVGGGALIVNKDHLVSIDRIENEIANLPDAPEDHIIRSTEITYNVNSLLNQARNGSSCDTRIMNIFKANLDLIPSRVLPMSEIPNHHSLGKIENVIAKRIERSLKYRKSIHNSGIKHPNLMEGNPLFRYSLLCDGKNPEKLRKTLTQKLRDSGIHASNLYYPAHKIFSEFCNREIPFSEKVGRRIINLWLDDNANDDYIQRTANVINGVLKVF